ncbi:Uncharacterised protein [Salmonella enterica subsp. arizonae]|uniref:Uncharacterized protein n=1 Tax=Salmonella enterica subsp. arizonae TaxID=59203 RepID=A0A2X4WSG0_SALER|nr:Uncharacterised protein [Salmonella enterica subsp. arizonae]
MPDRKSPSLYEILTGNFTGDLPLEVVNEEDQVILSVLDKSRVCQNRIDSPELFLDAHLSLTAGRFFASFPFAFAFPAHPVLPEPV